MPRNLALKLAIFTALGTVILSCVGCQPKPEKLRQNSASEAVGESRSIYRQAIDEAKSLEKRINDRAIDPEEKARLDNQNFGGQDQ